jgi:hypothetical protein
MSADALMQWKARIAAYQQQIKQSLPPQQTTLFDLSPVHVAPDSIDPFSLQLQPMSFWRYPAADPGVACLYFVIDCAEPLLLLYTGESKQSQQRWKNEHGCKGYVEKYIAVHRQYGLNPEVNIGFFWNAPIDRKARQQLELNLILKWRSPFNKQCWKWWGQPFGG